MSVDSVEENAVEENAKHTVDAAISKILSFADVARRQGLLAVIPLIDKKALEDRNNIFEYGIAMVCNGFEAEIIEDILQNIRSIKKRSFEQAIIDTLSIIGVLSIQAGHNPNVIIQRLDSRIPEWCRGDLLKHRIAKINMKLVDEEAFPREYLRPEETETEFENLATLNDRQIQELLREVDTDTLVWALKGNEKMKGVFYHNMNNCNIETMEEDIKHIERGKSVDGQRKIVAAAKRLKFL
jgi:hypothetical protein